MKMVRDLALVLGTAAAALAFTAGSASANGHGDYCQHGKGHGHHHGNGYGQHSGGKFGHGNGNQAYFPISIPINVCGNSIALLGLADSDAVCINR